MSTAMNTTAYPSSFRVDYSQHYATATGVFYISPVPITHVARSPEPTIEIVLPDSYVAETKRNAIVAQEAMQNRWRKEQQGSREYVAAATPSTVITATGLIKSPMLQHIKQLPDLREIYEWPSDILEGRWRKAQ